MPKSCAAYNCTSRSEGETKSLSFHKFPHGNPELLKKWVIASKRKNWHPTKSSVLCEKHFKETDYVHSDYAESMALKLEVQRKRLKSDAVPSKFAFLDHLVPKESKIRKPPARRNILKKCDVAQSTSSETSMKNCDHSYAASPSKKVKKLSNMISKKNRQIKRLKAQKLRRAKTIRSLIKELNKYKYLTNANADQMLIQNFNEMALDLFKNQARNSEKKTGSRYDKSIRKFAVTLHFHSPRGYRYVRKTLCLPNPSTIRSWAANIEVEPGFLVNVINSLERMVPSDQRDSIIILDEMSLKS
eukprot:gene16003-7336_t